MVWRLDYIPNTHCICVPEEENRGNGKEAIFVEIVNEKLMN